VVVEEEHASSAPPPPSIDDAVGGGAPPSLEAAEADSEQTQQIDPVADDDADTGDDEELDADDEDEDGPDIDASDDSETSAEDSDLPGLFDAALIEVESTDVTRSAGLFGLGATPTAPTAAPVPSAPLFGKSSSTAPQEPQPADEEEGESGANGHPDQHDLEKAATVDRLAPDLQRQLKRALADDQSDLLDAVRRGGKHASVDDLPAEDRQVARFADALETPLRASANAGATAAGGRIWPGLVDGLVATTAHKLVDDVRSVVIAAVQADGGDDPALESIRSHYRNVRTNRLNRLVDESLSGAFSLGVEHSADS
jgi:hypothetical protein